jgi:hypothetical protein
MNHLSSLVYLLLAVHIIINAGLYSKNVRQGRDIFTPPLPDVRFHPNR